MGPARRATEFILLADDHPDVSVLVDLTLVLLGLAFLVAGGEAVVRGASGLADHFGVSAFFVGVTVVAVGSSVPEIVTSAYAAAYGAPDLLVGHIVGSVTSQITLGVGLVGVVSPLVVHRSKTLTYGGGMLLAMLVMTAATLTGGISRLEGAGMIALYLVILTAVKRREDEATPISESTLVPKHAVPVLLAGLAVVLVGGNLVVTHDVPLADGLGVPQYLVGVVTGLGTTLPEVVVSLVAVSRDRGGIAIGTLLGSNITDPLFSLGVGAVAAGIHPTDPVASSLAYMLVASTFVVVLLAWRERVGRAVGVACLLAYLPTFLVL